MKCSLVVAALCLAFASTADAERVRDLMIPEVSSLPALRGPDGLAAYKTIFLNRCAHGCTVTPGSTDSRTDHSSLAQGTSQLAAFSGTDAQWQQIVDCVKDTFAVTGATITDVDPGTADHFEIMVAGFSSDIGLQADIFGVSPYACGTSGDYLPEALVFDFANQFYANPGAFGPNSNEEEICATAAQEISHALKLDHVTISSDPMTYNEFVGRRYFTNGPAQCGSDCVNGSGPFGQTCSGQNHVCACTGSETQNEVTTLQGLFGVGPGTPPTVTITNPASGANVSPGFPIAANATDNGPQGVTKVELYIDDQLVDMLTRGPFAFNAPTTLASGTHTIQIVAYDAQGTPGKASVDVAIGMPCQKPSDCSPSTDTCIGGRCVPGPSVQGGLGTKCTGSTDCASGQCASDGTTMYCVDMCTKGQCPSGFGCEIPTGMMSGVCWPGFDDGSGSSGGGCAVAPGGAIGSGLLFAVLVFSRRRRRS
jgi:hypothetical protein